VASPAFQGRVDGAVVPLEVLPGEGIVGPHGPVNPVSPIIYPTYHPTRGLVLASARPQPVQAAVDKPLEYPTHAGLVLKARDTGRVLMLQRSLEDENEGAAGRWEWPGGGLDPGDHNTLHGAIREWQEEVGQPVPGGVVAHTWTSPDGVYQGHVMVVPSEASVVLKNGRVTINPDDPGGDHHEQAAWWDPEHAQKNPALREECRGSPWKEIKMASAPLPGEPGLDEFADLPAEDNGVAGADPEHALPATYGDDAHLAALVTSQLIRLGTRVFTPAEQAGMISEGEGVWASNLDRLDLTGTHYALRPEDVPDEWMW
jgi:8-oxo-dGTP pyrophosphatase MutT (NUDIX family)